MSRSLLIASAAVIVLGLLLAFFAPTGNMGAQEAFYARVLLLIPSLICGLILFGFSAVVGAINRLETQGEQLRLLLAARSEVPQRQPARNMLPEDEEDEPELARPSILARAGNRLRANNAQPAAPEPPRRALPALEDDEALTPPPPARQAPPRFAPPPMAAKPVPTSPAPLRAPQMDGRAGELDASFLDRALRREPADIGDQPRNAPVPPPPSMPQPAARAPAPPPMAPAMAAPPQRAEPPVPPLPPIAPSFSNPPPAAAAAPARELPSAEKAPTIAELLERDLANWEPPAEKPKPRLVREGQFAGRNYRTFDDGSLEIDTEQSTLRFDSLEEFRAFVGSSHQ